MSEKPEIELDLDLQLLPAWARQPQTANRYADFDDAGGGERRGPRSRGPGGPGGPRRDFRGGDRSDGRRPGGPGGPSDRPQRSGEGRGGGGGGGGGGRFRGDRDRDRRGDRGDGRRPEPVEELPEGITVDLVPDPTGVDSLARQIRQTGRAYPLFDIAHLILKRPDRYQLHFRTHGNHADGSPRQLFSCNLDDTVWMSEGEATRHVLNKHFATFYQTEKIAVDPPKGTYTFVAQCGMSGVVLGPPNLHDYQSKLQRLHADRFSRVPFDAYKSRVRIVRDEAVVKQWIEEQSFKFEYICLNLPEPLKLNSREAVEQHFRQVHLPNIIKPESSHTVRTPAAREALPPPLRRLARREFDLQQRFPLKLVTRLSDDFAHRGLHFFKVNKTILHVAVARPRFLDVETSPVSEGVKRIVDTIQATPECTRRKLLEAMGVPLPPADAAPAAEGAEAPPPSPELSAIVSDLHWLIHEGHVIEFANGRVELAKKPAPRPTPPPRAPRAAPTPAPANADAETTTTAAAGSTGTTETVADTPAEPTAESPAEAPAPTDTATATDSNQEPAAESAPVEPTEPQAAAAAPVEPSEPAATSAAAESPTPPPAPETPAESEEQRPINPS